MLGTFVCRTLEFRAHLQERNMQAVIKPPPPQAAVDGGFTLDDIDTTTATCPAGVTVTIIRAGSARFHY